MSTNQKLKSRIRFANKTARYAGSHRHPLQSIVLYYGRTGCHILLLPFLLVGSLLCLLMNWSIFTMLTELTWEMFFSVKMVFVIILWFVFAFVPTCVCLLGAYISITHLSMVQKPMLVLTPDGLYHRGVAKSKEDFIQWSEIESIRVQPRHLNSKSRTLYFRMMLKASKGKPASVAWVELDSIQCECYTLYQNVLKYWRQYRGESWQGNPHIPETGWVN